MVLGMELNYLFDLTKEGRLNEVEPDKGVYYSVPRQPQQLPKNTPKGD
jgi:hypothetical protein